MLIGILFRLPSWLGKHRMSRVAGRSLVAGATLVLACSASLFGVPNSLAITEKAGVTTPNYPVQLGRPFVQGEIPNFPQALINGTAVATQADVKQRWPDGSVRHAVIAFLIPSLAANSTVPVTFQNQASGNNTPLTLAQMQDPSFNFGAQMQLTHGSTITADALSMLNAGAYTLWTSGNIAQTVILADHSAARTFDIGFDSNHSFRPIFQATFWPTIQKVTVRFIGENANTEALQDQTYSLVLTTGNSPSTQVYNKGSFTQSGATRWTKLYWIGGAPSAIAINHNLAYLESTTLLPNYDTSVTVSGTTLANLCNVWKGSNQDSGGAGNWHKNMPDAGSRPDIGIYEDWVVDYLYTGDSCMHDMAFGNADLAASWPIHVREGKAGKIFLRTDKSGSSTGLGHVLSLSGRPTVNAYSNFGTSMADQVSPVGAMTAQGWNYDTAHVPEPSSPMYLVSGDFWYLEEVWFWASYDVANDFVLGPYHRGPTGAEGTLNHGQIRAMAWELRNRVNAASITPDGTAESSYFGTLINDAIAAEEGARNITTTLFNGTPIWTFGRQQFAPSGAETGFPGFGITPAGTVTPLHQWSSGGTDFAQDEYGICSTYGAGQQCVPPTVLWAESLFEMDYMLYSLGRAKELGYPAGALVTWLGSLYTGMLTDPGFNPYIIDNGRVPTVRVDSTFFQSFADLKNGYNAAWQAANSLGTDPDGYSAYVVAGVSFLINEPNGQASWTFMKQNFPWSSFSTTPKWALVPRNLSFSPCDLNTDGVVNALDVQISIQQALGESQCTNGDLDGNGICNVIDVQRVINAVSSGKCRVGQ